jgi:hypothetical protein
MDSLERSKPVSEALRTVTGAWARGRHSSHKAKLEDDRGRAGRASRELMEAPVLGLAGSLGLWK